MVGDLLTKVEPGEPAIGQVHAHFFQQPALARDPVEIADPQQTQQHFGIDRRSSGPAVGFGRSTSIWARTVMHLAGMDEYGKLVVRKRFSRSQLAGLHGQAAVMPSRHGSFWGAGIDSGGVLQPTQGWVMTYVTDHLRSLTPYSSLKEDSSGAGVNCGPMAMRVEKISAVTLRVANMQRSVGFYKDVMGMQVVYGGEDTYFSSLRATDAEYPILNLEQGRSATRWGRMIFYVADVDEFWRYLKERGLDPARPQDASWGERYFHMSDPDGHELSFAHPLRPAS